jgi:hypothetical protein
VVFEASMEEASDVYYQSRIRSPVQSPRPYIYELKPRVNQLDALWSIIDYSRNKEAQEKAQEDDDDEKACLESYY